MLPIEIKAPSSKSLSHRALICAALAQGESVLDNILDSDDLSRTTECLRLLGANIEPRADQIRVRGINPGPGPTTAPVSMNMGESGTTCRLMMSVVTAFPGQYHVHGQGRLHQRPVADLTDALDQQGISIEFTKKQGFLPLTISSQGLKGGPVNINLEQSSQYLSGLLLAAPLASGPTTIYLRGHQIASWPYVALTLDAMRQSGVPVILEQRVGDVWLPCTQAQAARLAPADLCFKVQPRAYLAGPRSVEGDWSNASYFLAAGAVGQAPVRIAGLSRTSAQGDKFMLDILQRMGARIQWDKDTVTVFPSNLCGISVNMGSCPDLVPTVAALAAFAHKETHIFGAAHLRLKECDRIQGPVAELAKAGVRIAARPDGLIISGRANFTSRPLHLLTYDDHRMAMSLSLLELGGCAIDLDNPGCVAKSFPKFWQSWELVRQGNSMGSPA